MNKNTLIVTIIIMLFGIGSIIVSFTGILLPSNIDENYIRQGSASRQFQGGGIRFGK